LDKKSEADHDFGIDDARQDWTTNQTFKYPDKTQTTARGRAHVGGLSRWKMKNLKPGKEVIIAKRIDFVRGDIVARIEVDGQAAGAPEAIPAPVPVPKPAINKKTVILQESQKVPVVGWLVALTGKHKGDDFRVKEGKNIIGSDADCDVILTDDFISSKHANLK